MSSQTKQLISVTDLNGNYTYVNNAYCQTTGYDKNELLNTDTRRLTHNIMPKSVIDELSTTLAKGFSWQGMMLLQSKKKQELWLDSFITPQYQQGKIIGFQCISTIAPPTLTQNARNIYQALNKHNEWAIFELTKNHKFAFLVLISLIAQTFIFTTLGITASIVAALSAITPILVFWSDIIPTARRAQRMQNMFDSISRKSLFRQRHSECF